MQMRWLALRTRVVESTRLPFAPQKRQYNIRKHSVGDNPRFEKRGADEEPRANHRPRYNRPDDVPFVESESHGINDQSYFSERGDTPTLTPAQLERRSTISHYEKAAFARLFDRVGLPQQLQDPGKIDGLKGHDRLAGLDAAVSKRFDTAGRARNPLPLPASLQEMLAGMQARDDDKQLETELAEARKKAAREEKERLLPFVRTENGEEVGRMDSAHDGVRAVKETVSIDPRLLRLRESHHDYVEKKLLAAQTDQELWQVIEDEAFKIIEELRLDETKAEPKPRKKGRPGKKAKSTKDEAVGSPTQDSTPEDKAIAAISSTSELQSLDRISQLQIMGANYPSLLLSTARQLRTSFPASTLPLNLLPSIRQLGRSSYILGASTPLYNELIEHNWRSLSDFEAINGLLMEMENAALDFDIDTQTLLRDIRREGYKNFDGQNGESLQAVWRLDRVQREWKGVMEWWPIVNQRLGLVGGFVET